MKRLGDDFMFDHKVIPPEIKRAAEVDFDLALDRKKPFLNRLRNFALGEKKLGRTIGQIADFITIFVPYGRVINSGREAVRHILTKKQKRKNMNWILNRLKEKSTWRGIVGVITALGVTLSPEQTVAIVTLGVAVAGAVEVFFKEPQSEDA